MAKKLWQKAAAHPGNYVYSFRREEETALRAALVHQPQDGLAHALLGMLELYRLNPEKAVPELEQAVRLRPEWDQPIRLLSICQRMLGRTEEAAKALERAVAVNPVNPGLYTELDELLAELADGESRREKLWANVPGSVLDEDHARGRFAAFLIDRGEYAQAVEILLEHTFFPEEGSGVYRELFVSANLGLALEAAEAGFSMQPPLSTPGKQPPILSAWGCRHPLSVTMLPPSFYKQPSTSTAGKKRLPGHCLNAPRENVTVKKMKPTTSVDWPSRYLGQEEQAQAKFERLVEKSKLDAAWPGRDPDYCALLAVLGKAGLGLEIPSLESLPPVMRKKTAIYGRLFKLLPPIQGGARKQKYEDSFLKT